MNKFSSAKNYLYALLLAFMALAMLPACSSTDEAAQTDPGCDPGDSKEECADAML